jgi:hypothetical protein
VIDNGSMWVTTVIWALVDAGLLALLLWRVKPDRFRRSAWPFVIASAIFWGIFAISLYLIFWDTYYSHFIPPYVRWLAPLAAIEYGLVGWLLWWLARKLPGNPVLSFCLLGGLESILEHLLGSYGLKILDVPMLQGLTPLSILAFAFFEYILYWGVVVALAALISWGRQLWMVRWRPQVIPQ